jgi:hypothetical protein
MLQQVTQLIDFVHIQLQVQKAEAHNVFIERHSQLITSLEVVQLVQLPLLRQDRFA